ncbi:MAG: 4Fe-4S binding protein [Negativibacillus sp.]
MVLHNTKPNSMDCIRCGECLKRCPKKATHKKEGAEQ